MAKEPSPLVRREEAPLNAPARDQRDDVLKAETRAGKRLRGVKIEDGALVLEGTEEAQRAVMEAFGGDSREFQTYCLGQLITILPESGSGDDYTLPINSAVAMLRAINPKDELEAMLAVQMVASHHMAMLSTRRTKNTNGPVQIIQANGNLATKFSRTFIAQLEALDRHRRGGKQIVEHVHVNAGGQAVIAGTVNTGEGGRRG
jgi:hypothetical protein